MFHRVASKAPPAGIAIAFLLSVAGARFFSLLFPRVHWEPAGVHIHHYVYGIFILTVAGYLALVLRNDGARPWIALLYGLGVGLTFDEFGMWLNPPFVRGVRWNTNGITLVVVGLVVSLVLIPFRNRLRVSPSNSLGRFVEEAGGKNNADSVIYTEDFRAGGGSRSAHLDAAGVCGSAEQITE
jgi:tetrahydromethanopterin S-methyltransferase subunit E